MNFHIKVLQKTLFHKSVTDGPLQDKPNYVSLLKRLSAILKPMNLLLTSEGTVNKNVITRGFKNRLDFFLLDTKGENFQELTFHRLLNTLTTI
jgi:hypothetical protein